MSGHHESLAVSGQQGQVFTYTITASNNPSPSPRPGCAGDQFQCGHRTLSGPPVYRHNFVTITRRINSAATVKSIDFPGHGLPVITSFVGGEWHREQKQLHLHHQGVQLADDLRRSRIAAGSGLNTTPASSSAHRRSAAPTMSSSTLRMPTAPVPTRSLRIAYAQLPARITSFRPHTPVLIFWISPSRCATTQRLVDPPPATRSPSARESAVSASKAI